MKTGIVDLIRTVSIHPYVTYNKLIYLSFFNGKGRFFTYLFLMSNTKEIDMHLQNSHAILILLDVSCNENFYSCHSFSRPDFTDLIRWIPYTIKTETDN